MATLIQSLLNWLRSLFFKEVYKKNLNFLAINLLYINIFNWLLMDLIIFLFLNIIKILLLQKEMELTLVGLQNSGKTTLVNVICVSLCEIKYLYDLYYLNDYSLWIYK